MKKDLVEFFRGHLLGGLQSREEGKEIIHFHKSCRKMLERNSSGFTHCVLLLGEGTDWKEIPE